MNNSTKLESPVAKGHPVKLTKADIKNTKKCVILNQYTQDGYVHIEYESGISKGHAQFQCGGDGEKMLTKFLKLLNK